MQIVLIPVLLLFMIGFKIIGAQIQNISPNVKLKKRLGSRPKTIAWPNDGYTSPKRELNSPPSFNQPKEPVLKENTKFP